MTLQTIKSADGKVEYVLLPVKVYEALHDEIETKLAGLNQPSANESVPFVLDDYVDNPVALARIKAGVTQKELALRMAVSQAYISKIEGQAKVTPKLLDRVNSVLSK